MIRSAYSKLCWTPEQRCHDLLAQPDQRPSESGAAALQRSSSKSCMRLRQPSLQPAIVRHAGSRAARCGLRTIAARGCVGHDCARHAVWRGRRCAHLGAALPCEPCLEGRIARWVPAFQIELLWLQS